MNADGSPGSSPLTMPGTGAIHVGMLGRTPLAARPGGGFYVAYPTPGGVRVWRAGQAGRLGASSDAATSDRRLLPGLTLQASPSRLRADRRALHGARRSRVRVAGRSGTTDSRGRVTLSVTVRRAVTARATRTDHTTATTGLGMRR